MNAANILVPGPCELHCRFCKSEQNDPVGPVRTDSEIRAEILSAAEQGDKQIFLGAGGFEPSTYPGIEELIKYCRFLGFKKISLRTNGMATADKKLLKRFADAGLTEINVTFMSSQAETTDAFCGGKGVLSRKIASIKNSLALGIRTECQVVITNENIGELPAIMDLFEITSASQNKLKKRAMFEIYIFTPNYTVRNFHIFPGLVPSYGETATLLEAMAEEYPGFYFQTKGIPRCAFSLTPLPQNINISFDFSAADNHCGRPLQVRLGVCETCRENKICQGLPLFYMLTHPGFNPKQSIPENTLNAHTAATLKKTSSNVQDLIFLRAVISYLSTYNRNGWSFSHVMPLENSVFHFCFTNEKEQYAGIILQPAQRFEMNRWKPEDFRTSVFWPLETIPAEIKQIVVDLSKVVSLSINKIPPDRFS